MTQLQKIDVCLCFDGKAEEAAQFYTSVMEDSRIVHVLRAGKTGPGPEGSVIAVSFQLGGHNLMALNGGPDTRFSAASSLMIKCETQEEIDHIWEKLLDGGKPMACGWLQDRYGVTWQVTPNILLEMIHDKDAARVDRVMQAMRGMIKLEIAPLRAAFLEAGG